MLATSAISAAFAAAISASDAIAAAYWASSPLHTSDEYHNDDIEELNAVEGVSINELYAVTADRDNRVKPTIVQPEWDASKKLGRRSYKPGDGESMRAKEFRDARKAGAEESPGVSGTLTSA